MKDRWVVVIGISILVSIFIAFFTVYRYVDHHMETQECKKFAQVSNYETKFADYNWFLFECLAKTADGKWVPKSQLRDVSQ